MAITIKVTGGREGLKKEWGSAFFVLHLALGWLGQPQGFLKKAGDTLAEEGAGGHPRKPKEMKLWWLMDPISETHTPPGLLRRPTRQECRRLGR